MKSRFIDRQKELTFLEEKYRSAGFQLIIIHGRRRVGKTELIKRFINGKRSVYLLADNIPGKILLEQLYRDTTQQTTGQSFLFGNINEYFKYLTSLGEERIVVVFDEFQNMIRRIDGIESIMQRFVDEHWNLGQLYIILCGSEIRMMQELFRYSNPLYGRRTGQLKIRGFEFHNLLEFFPTLPLSDVLKIWGIYGSMPAYLQYYNPEKSLIQNIESTIFSEVHPLFEEVKFLLVQEFKETQRYSGILQKIAEGNTRVIDIANATGIEARSLPKYLNILVETDLIHKRIPAGVKSRTNLIRYEISDAFIKFWFYFVSPNLSSLLYTSKPVLNKVMSELNSYMGRHFETACQSLLARLNEMEKLPALYIEISVWWRKEIEFDLVLLGHDEILILELKYSSSTSGNSVLRRLRKKISRSPFASKQVYCGVIAQGFKDQTEGCYTLSDLVDVINSERGLVFPEFVA